LTVTRFESGREIIAEEKINLKELILSFLPSLEVVANKKDVKIAIDIKDENINLISDKEKISEVIYNFIDNAVKHSSAGQTITISVSRFSPKFAKIEVIDQGEGIAKKLQSKLFAKFSQLDSSLSRSQEGTGLGLYICKLIVEKLGGEIGVKSTLGKGSSFFFTLPIAV
jgi:signal transduction histidine kinase